MISVLVTGATTSMGERLVRSLVADTRVDHVLAVDAEPPERALPFSHGKRLTYLQVDLARDRGIRNLLFGPVRDLGVEVVVHLAEHARAHSIGKRVHAMNVEALRSILDLSNRHPTIRRVVVKSYAEVYKVSLDLPVLVEEDHPLDLSPTSPQYIRDRVEADLTACARMGLADCEIVVLRCAEALGPGTGSQLYDFLDAPIALRPAGFDPMVNVATVADLVDALEKATHGSGEGVFNIPGYDTLPLSECIAKWGTPTLPLPGPLVRPLYGLRHRLRGSDFSYGMNRGRMHYGLVLDGTRARTLLGYVPDNPVDWPVGGAVHSEGMMLLILWFACSHADVSVSPTALDYGDVDFQQDKPAQGYDPQTVTVTNNGKDPVDLVIENFDATHLFLGAQLVVDDPPTLGTLATGQQAVLTVSVWDYDVEKGERDNLVSGSFDLNAPNLKDPLTVTWSFTPVRHIGGDTGT